VAVLHSELLYPITLPYSQHITIIITTIIMVIIIIIAITVT